MAQVMTNRAHAMGTREAMGAGLGLLGTFVAAMAFAYLLPRLAFYVTFLMPVLVGFLLSALGAIGPRRFGFGHARALVGIMVAGSLVCWVGHHAFAYLRIVDFFASQPSVVEMNPADPVAAALAWMNEVTGETGFWAYLTFVSEGRAAQFSPIGVLGRSEIGPMATVIVAAVELALMAGVAGWTVLFRTRHLRESSELATLGVVDQATLASFVSLVEARRFEEAGEALAAPVASPTHVVMARDGAVTTEVRVYSLAGDGSPGEKVASKLLPREGGDAMRKGFHAALGGKR